MQHGYQLLLSTVVLVSFIVTIVLAVGSYLAFKGREVRRPAPDLASRSGEPGLLRADLSPAEEARSLERWRVILSGNAAKGSLSSQCSCAVNHGDHGIVNCPCTPEISFAGSTLGFAARSTSGSGRQTVCPYTPPGGTGPAAGVSADVEALDVERAEPFENSTRCRSPTISCVIDAASVAPVYALRLTAARIALMIATAAAPPCASARSAAPPRTARSAGNGLARGAASPR